MASSGIDRNSSERHGEPPDSSEGHGVPVPSADLLREKWVLQCQLAEVRHALQASRAELERTLQSRSWRATHLLRTGLSFARRLRSDGSGQPVLAPLESVASFVEASASGHAPLLLVDVTELVIENLQGGVQHTVKGILSEWLFATPGAYRVVPVKLTREGVYVSASADLQHLFGPFNDPYAGKQVPVQKGDIFLGLDLLRDRAAEFRAGLERLRRLGAHIEIVVYDLVPVDMPQFMPKRVSKAFNEWLDVVGDLADGVSCISASVAARFSHWLATRPDRDPGIAVSSFRLGAPLVQPCQIRSKSQNRGGVSFLMVGTVEPRKGYEQTLDAFEKLWSSADGADISLCIVGRYGWGVPQILSRLESHQELGRRLIWLRQATDEEVQTCYAQADALLFSSYGEGFGLPIVEAAQHGLPLILRDLPEFREVAGDSALYFRGQTEAELLAVIRRWLELARTGQAPVPRKDIAVTWAQSAEQLASLIGALKAADGFAGHGSNGLRDSHG